MECRSSIKFATLLSLLLAAVFALNGCTNPEKAKAQHVARGEAFLKEERFQEASLEFRNAIQIDDKLAAAHWGLARAYEGLLKIQDMINELERVTQLDANHLEARTKLGNLYLFAAQGRANYISEAERLAKEILQKNPDHIEGHILMGGVFYAQNDRDKALAEFNRAVELDPKRVESYISLARFYVRTEDRAKAEETLKQAIAINNNSALARTEYGRFLVQANRYPEAEAELLKAVEVEPKNRDSHFVLAGYYIVSKQLDKAEAAYKALAEIEKDKPESQAVLADFYASTKRPDEAVKIYQDILTKYPDFKQGRYRLGEILLARGDTQGAMGQIDELLKQDQHDRRALILRARLRASTGQTSELKAAIEDLKEVLKQEPNSKEGLYLMAQSHLSLLSLDEARVFARELERYYPEYLPAKLIQIQISSMSSDPKVANPKTTVALATDLLDRVSKTAPDRENSAQALADMTVRALVARATAHVKMRNYAASRKDLDAALEIAPRYTDIYVNLAALAMADKKYDEAASLYEEALSISATDFNALYGMINMYAAQSQIEKAHARLDQVLSSYPNNASLHYLKAQIYGFERNVQAAENELRKTLELDSNYIPAYSALGALFINTRQEDRAIAEYKRIVELRPDNATAYTLIGMLYDARKDHNAAADNYRKALQQDPNAVIAANNLAWLYAVTGTGNLDEAVRLAQGVVQQNPQVAGFVDTLGWVYYKKGLNDVAVQQLQKAVSLDEAAANRAKVPPSPTYRYHLGMALKAKGDAEGAKREIGVALRLADKVPFPDAEEARKALATL
ncbi:MAG TPA: tetratricopeptide repeat protein [Pyrinomonadaceae bacterium]|nr:tetratricopeptide repeat protein [Pyrinomonadaceae bacterium]